MNDQQRINGINQVMELREIIKLFFDYKWFIIIVTGLSLIIAFISTVFLISPKYTSSAFITLTEPILIAEFESSIQISPIMPDTQALAELVETDEICRTVVERLELVDYFGLKKPDLEASLRGKSQLRLEATDTDPKIASELANTWAIIVVERLNEVYGVGEFSQANIRVMVDNSMEDWANAQEELEDFLPESKVAIIEVELSQRKNKLSRFLNRIENNIEIIEDANSLDSRLAAQSNDQELPLGDALSLIALQQRSSGNISGAEFQIQGNNPFGEQFSIGEARKSLTSLKTSLQEQNIHIEAEIVIIKDNISRLTVELESEIHQVEILTQERDLARRTYIALANQMAENRITDTQDAGVARISSPAVVSNEPSGNSILINSALAGIAGLSLSILSVLIIEWWKTDEN